MVPRHDKGDSGMIDMETQLQFVKKHTESNLDRIAEDLLNNVAKNANLKILSTPEKKDGQWCVYADALNPNAMFDHIELKISITGYGRMME